MSDQKFNLINSPWIPVEGGLISLRQVFSDRSCKGLSGNATQKIAVMKLLLAIAQAAQTPSDEDAWVKMGPGGMSELCLDYLHKWRDRFFLYGPDPFLQMPSISAAAVQSFGALLPEVSTGGTTILSARQVERSLDDAEKALLIVVLGGFSLAGKKVDNKVTLTPGYQGKLNEKGKPSSGRHGPSVGHMGFLHSFILGETLLQSIWLNLLSSNQVNGSNLFPGGVGRPPWEAMPSGEDCATAKILKTSLMGRLVPMSRFCLIAPDGSGVHYSEGLYHAGYKDGLVDPSVAVNNSGKEPKALWVDPEKRPWRELTSLLSFFGQSSSSGFQSLQVRSVLGRLRGNVDRFAVWSAGLRVSSNAGEQYVTGSNDFVDSVLWLQSDMMGEAWFSRLKSEMDDLNSSAKSLYGSVFGFFKEQKVDGSDSAAAATNVFWQICERDFQNLLDACYEYDANSGEELKKVKGNIKRNQTRVYDQFCSQASSRQLAAWAKFHPTIKKPKKEAVNE